MKRWIIFCGISVFSLLLFSIIAVLIGQTKALEVQKSQLQLEIHTIISQLDSVRNEDQYVKNAKLSEEIAHIQKTYKQATSVYEALVDIRLLTKDTEVFDAKFAESLTLLANRNWATASSHLQTLSGQIDLTKSKLLSTISVPINAPSNNTPPNSGFSRQSVRADIGDYVVDIISADMSSTRIIIDTASANDCKNDCPVMSLSDYVNRNSAFAGVNGAYFCPADYPSCAEKKNSFDTLLMNKNKTYFNSDNNVYSTVPAVIFLNGSMRFVGRSLEWGRDTSPDGVIANQGLLLSGGNIVYGDDGDPKKGSHGNRSFVGNKGTTAYIGVVHNATVAEVAHVLKALGLDGALNLDSGGSTALWSGGYKVGPGRNIPNAILFVRK